MQLLLVYIYWAERRGREERRGRRQAGRQAGESFQRRMPYSP